MLHGVSQQLKTVLEIVGWDSIPGLALEMEEPGASARTPISVRDLTGTIRELLEDNLDEVWVAGEISNLLQTLPQRQREVLQSIAVDGASIKDTSAKFAMSEGAVRVALHRALSGLTAKLREH